MELVLGKKGSRIILEIIPKVHLFDTFNEVAKGTKFESCLTERRFNRTLEKGVLLKKSFGSTHPKEVAKALKREENWLNKMIGGRK